MKAITGAIVLLSGTVLLGAAILTGDRGYQAGGIGGGFLIGGFGIIVLLLGLRDMTRDELLKRD